MSVNQHSAGRTRRGTHGRCVPITSMSIRSPGYHAGRYSTHVANCRRGSKNATYSNLGHVCMIDNTSCAWLYMNFDHEPYFSSPWQLIGGIWSQLMFKCKVFKEVMLANVVARDIWTRPRHKSKFNDGHWRQGVVTRSFSSTARASPFLITGASQPSPERFFVVQAH